MGTKTGLVDLPRDLVSKIGELVIPKYKEGFEYKNSHGNWYKHLDPTTHTFLENGVWFDEFTPEEEKRERYQKIEHIEKELKRETAKLDRLKKELKTIDQVSEDRKMVKRKYDIWSKIIHQDEEVELLQNDLSFMRQILFFRRAMLSHQKALRQVP